MGGRLIINGAEACDLASRLAALTGESMADAVTRALRAEIEILPFTGGHAREARRARALSGKPHPAQLNFGDCMVYGVARHEREPLLFKSGDFARTDIEPVLRD